MATILPLVIVGSLAGGFICLGLAVAAWRYREVPVALTFGAFVFAIAAVSFANVAYLTSDGRTAAYVADRVVRAAAVQISPLWLLFVLAYVGKEEWITYRTITALWAFPVGYVLLSVTAPLHGLANTPVDVHLLTVNGVTAPYIQPGAITLPTYVYSYGVAGAGLLLLVSFTLRSRAVHRKQTFLLLGATATGMVMAMASQAGMVSHPGIDVTPLGFVVVGAAIGWALLRYDFLRHMPLAENVLVDELPDPVFVVDDDDRIIDYNPAAVDAFGQQDPTSEPIDDVVSGLTTHLDDGTVFCRDCPGTDGAGPTHYEPSVTLLKDQYGAPRGRLVVLRDITGQQRRQERLEALQASTRKFLGASTDEQIAEIAVEYAERTLGGEAAGALLADESGALRPAAINDVAGRLFDRDELVVGPGDDSVAFRAYERGEPMETDVTPAVGGPLERAIFLPLGDHGVLSVAASDPDVFGPNDEDFATILARTTHVALARVERESELRRNRRALERRTEQIAFFNGVLRHSLRNALLVIEGRAEHLREVGSEEETEHVDTIVQWCGDLAELSEEIRSVNDTVTASESERLEVVDLSALLAERLAAHEERYPGATFEVDVDDGIDIQANKLVRSVLDSVVDNAIEHNDGGTPHVEVWTVRAADRVQVHVADDGPGMTDEMKSVVFERAVSTDQTASGFGLHFVSVLMNLYGGNLRFEDNDPEGTVAVLEFQVADDGDGSSDAGGTPDAVPETGEGVDVRDGTVTGTTGVVAETADHATSMRGEGGASAGDGGASAGDGGASAGDRGASSDDCGETATGSDGPDPPPEA